LTEKIRGKYIADYWCEDEELLREKPPEDYRVAVANGAGAVRYNSTPRPIDSFTVVANSEFLGLPWWATPMPLTGGPLNSPVESPKRDINYKYSEDESIEEIAKYIAGTYGEHYAADNNIQAFDVWAALAEGGDPSSSHRDTAIKYLYRYGRKGGFNRKDLLKTVHYCLMLLHYNKKFHGK
jgi:hypothetical protein